MMLKIEILVLWCASFGCFFESFGNLSLKCSLIVMYLLKKIQDKFRKLHLPVVLCIFMVSVLKASGSKPASETHLSTSGICYYQKNFK